MKVELLNHQIKEIKPTSEIFLSQLQIKVHGENIFESPLHKLPELLRLLTSKGLNSYTLNFFLNDHGRFDVEINAKYPPILLKKINASEEMGKYAIMSIYEKMHRLVILFQGHKDLPPKNMVDYSEFMSNLASLPQKYSSWSDQDLYAFPGIITDSEKLYRYLTPASQQHALENDQDFRGVQAQNEFLASPIADSAQKPCPFDRQHLVKQQLIHKQAYFLVSFNYTPYGNSAYHLMIIANSHTADLTTATGTHLFELEALLYATLKISPVHAKQMVITMNKHISSFMTVPHVHIHALVKPKLSEFKADILNQIRYLVRSHVKDISAQQVAKVPLTPSCMRDRAIILQAALRPILAETFRANYQQNGLFKPQRALQLVDMKKTENEGVRP